MLFCNIPKRNQIEESLASLLISKYHARLGAYSIALLRFWVVLLLGFQGRSMRTISFGQEDLTWQIHILQITSLRPLRLNLRGRRILLPRGATKPTSPTAKTTGAQGGKYCRSLNNKNRVGGIFHHSYIRVL